MFQNQTIIRVFLITIISVCFYLIYVEISRKQYPDRLDYASVDRFTQKCVESKSKQSIQFLFDCKGIQVKSNFNQIEDSEVVFSKDFLVINAKVSGFWLSRRFSGTQIALPFGETFWSPVISGRYSEK
jgi:hypothetical protein